MSRPLWMNCGCRRVLLPSPIVLDQRLCADVATLAQNCGKVSEIRDPLGRVWQIAYAGPAGNLETVTYPRAEARHNAGLQRAEQHRLAADAARVDLGASNT